MSKARFVCRCFCFRELCSSEVNSSKQIRLFSLADFFDNNLLKSMFEQASTVNRFVIRRNLLESNLSCFFLLSIHHQNRFLIHFPVSYAPLIMRLDLQPWIDFFSLFFLLIDRFSLFPTRNGVGLEHTKQWIQISGCKLGLVPCSRLNFFFISHRFLFHQGSH